MRPVLPTFNLQGSILDFDTPKVMAIINISPESFYKGSVSQGDKAFLKEVEKHLRDGADIIDIGAVSSKPFAPEISVKEEWERLSFVVQSIVKQFPECLVSVDTTRSSIAEKVLDLGVHIINDVSGLDDLTMIKVTERYKCAYVLMHIQGTPQTMQVNPKYEEPTLEILHFFKEKLSLLSQHNHQIIVDPGFGFGKTLEHNFKLLSALGSFRILDLPILVGLSRKSMIYRLLNMEPDDALNGTTAAHMIALLNGAQILRVHDTNEARQTVNIFNFYKDNQSMN